MLQSTVFERVDNLDSFYMSAGCLELIETCLIFCLKKDSGAVIFLNREKKFNVRNSLIRTKISGPFHRLHAPAYLLLLIKLTEVFQLIHVSSFNDASINELLQILAGLKALLVTLVVEVF